MRRRRLEHFPVLPEMDGKEGEKRPARPNVRGGASEKKRRHRSAKRAAHEAVLRDAALAAALLHVGRHKGRETVQSAMPRRNGALREGVPTVFYGRSVGSRRTRRGLGRRLRGACSAAAICLGTRRGLRLRADRRRFGRRFRLVRGRAAEPMRKMPARPALWSVPGRKAPQPTLSVFPRFYRATAPPSLRKRNEVTTATRRPDRCRDAVARLRRTERRPRRPSA